MTDEKKIITTIKFPESLRDKLTELAEADQRNFSNYVIKVLTDHINGLQEH